MANPKLVLIDGHSLAFRAFHALPLSLTAANGEVTNAVFGFTSMLLNVLRDQQPEYVAVAFDVGRTFRHDMYAGYKGHRERMPDELRTQVERIKEVVGTLNIPIFTKDGFEADDVLATLARQAEEIGVDTVIVTGDRDILQVVNEHITVLTSGRQFSDTIFYTPEAIQARYGLRADQLVDLKALVGDKSDNIPGVRGVGEKGATALLQTYGTLDAVYAHLDDISAKRTQEALREYRSDAELSRTLGRIITTVPIQLDLPACRTQDYDRNRVVGLFKALSFRTLVDRLPDSRSAEVPASPPAPRPSAEPQAQMSLIGMEPASVNVPAPPAPHDYMMITTQESLERVAASLGAAGMVAFDTETTGTDPQVADLVGVALAWGRGPGQAAYIPLRHPDVDPLPWEQVRTALQPVFGSPKTAMAAHNASYDVTMLGRNGLKIAGELIDTMVAAWLIDPGSHSLGLKELAWTRLGAEMTQITELIGRGKQQLTMDQVPAAQVTPYAAADAAMTLGLAEVLLPELADKGLMSLFKDVEMPLVPVLVAMETAGIKLDVPTLRQMSGELSQRLRQLEREIQQIAGYAFNINSTQQLAEVLFGKLGLPAGGLKKTKAGAYSTAADVLEGLRGRHEIVDLILEQRQLSKLLSTYVDALPEMVNRRTGRVHTSYNQAGAETGRLSSTAPNLQNIPVRTEIGREIRRAFVAEPGWRLLSADYSQVELRILAHISGDENLLQAFARGEDIHASAAAAVYGVPLDQVTKAQRSVAKMMNFATSYGVSAFGLAQRTGLGRNEAAEFMSRYFATYPGVARYLEETKAQARETGSVATLLGRKRFFPVLKSTATGGSLFTQRQAAERAAINHPIQGTAADIIKIAMIHLYRALVEGSFRSRICLQVHDELVLEAPEEELATVAPLVRQTMEAAYLLDAPLRVDMEAGPNWFEMTGIS